MWVVHIGNGCFYKENKDGSESFVSEWRRATPISRQKALHIRDTYREQGISAEYYKVVKKGEVSNGKEDSSSEV